MTVFYENFLALCAKTRKTPSGVARAIGLSNAAASGWKKGKIPNDTTLLKIADYFGVTVEELTAEKENKPALPQENELDELRRKAIEELLKAPDKKIEAVIALLSDK